MVGEQVGRQTRSLGWLWAFGILVVAQLVALYWPRVSVQGPVTWTDKVVHVLLFALPALAGLRARLRPAYVLGLLALHAPVSEVLQHVVLPNRSGDPRDIVADLTGLALGATVAVVGRAPRRW